MQCWHKKTQNFMPISNRLKKVAKNLMEGGDVGPTVLEVIQVHQVQVLYSCKYLTTSMTRGLLGSSRRKAMMLAPPYLKSSKSTRCKSCHSCKYLTTSITRGLLGSTKRKAVMLVPPYDLLDERVVGVHKAEGSDVVAAIFVHMYLTTSWTRGLLGSTRRKAVMLPPQYVPDNLLDERVVGVHKEESCDVAVAICT
jgi:hypothetical protein